MSPQDCRILGLGAFSMREEFLYPLLSTRVLPLCVCVPELPIFSGDA